MNVHVHKEIRELADHEIDVVEGGMLHVWVVAAVWAGTMLLFPTGGSGSVGPSVGRGQT